MKRIVLLFCTMCVMTIVHVHAQIPLGFKAGINTNKIVVRNTTHPNGDSDAGISFHLGVFSKLKLSDKFHFIPEVQFIQKQQTNYGGKFRLSYIELPLLVSYRPVPPISVEAGPSFGLNIGSSLSADVYKKADCGVVGGFRFNLTSKLSLLARYYYGVTPIEKIYVTFNPPGSLPPIDMKFYNQTLQFSVAYYLK